MEITDDRLLCVTLGRSYTVLTDSQAQGRIRHKCERTLHAQISVYLAYVDEEQIECWYQSSHKHEKSSHADYLVLHSNKKKY